MNIQVIGSTNDPIIFPRDEYTQTIPEAQEFNYTVATIVADNPEPGLSLYFTALAFTVKIPECTCDILSAQLQNYCQVFCPDAI